MRMLFLLSKYLCLGACVQEEEKKRYEKKRGGRERREGMRDSKKHDPF